MNMNKKVLLKLNYTEKVLYNLLEKINSAIVDTDLEWMQLKSLAAPSSTNKDDVKTVNIELPSRSSSSNEVNMQSLNLEVKQNMWNTNDDEEFDSD